jgi:hypothetical protein
MRMTAALAAVAMLSACAANQPARDDQSIKFQSPVVVTSAEPQPTAPSISKWAILDDLNGAAIIARDNNDPDGFRCADAGAAWVGRLPFPEETQQKPLVLPDQRGLAIDFEIARLKAREARERLKNAKASIAALREAILAGPPREVVIACAVVVHDAKKDLLDVLGLAKVLAAL